MNKSILTLMTSRIDVILKNLHLCKYKINRSEIGSVISGICITSFLAPIHLVEYITYKIRTKNIKVQSPVFIVGHWRCGTTLWQYMLARDKHFSFVDPFSAYAVNMALWRPLMRKPLPEQLKIARNFDNMEFRVDLPYEESICFAQYSPYSNWNTHLFPMCRDRYMSYSFVDELSAKEQKKWFAAYDGMMRKFTAQIGHGKPFVLKSPDITARVKYMSEQYPDAVFINVYRNPYVVIRSTLNMYNKTTTYFTLQGLPSPQSEEDFVIKEFIKMYHKYFDDIQHIAPERIIEFKFEEFEKDPMPMLKETYDKFGWDWESAKDDLKAYWDKQTGYKKNVFDYTPHLIQRINDELGFYFEHYGYEKMAVPEETIYM